MKKRSKESQEKGKAFERLAKAAGFKWAQLARELGVTPQTIQNWRERGVASTFAVRTAELLGCEPTDISWIAQSVVEITNRRPLTAREKIAQQNLRAIWNAKKKELGLTQEKAAHQFGWSSQGAVGAYLLGRTPVNTDALLKFAKLLQVKPTDIDPDFQWGDMVSGQQPPSAQTYTSGFTITLDDEAPPPPKAELPRHVRDLVDAILRKARDGSLTKEHTAVLKSSLELMTGNKR